MIDSKTIDAAAGILLKSAPPGSEVILFGSYADGRARQGSDLDFPVVEPTVGDRVAEMVRLTDSLRPLRIPVDVLVVSRDRFEYWRQTPNTIYFAAAAGGKVYGQVA
jgi:predicted nucleotidyltransferase